MEQLMEVNVPYIYVIANNVKWQIISINREVGRYEFSACYQTAADCPNRVVNQGSLSRKLLRWTLRVTRDLDAFEDGNDHRPRQLTPKQYLNAGNWLARRRGEKP